ncbi:hypothetical protein AAIE21_04935 [Paenibacillus sp. 102]|uniref:hypothetical protein n=1 Tax=Paenibacillus sp. 102 TaxID=3120823 RepID=UPI0031B9E690
MYNYVYPYYYQCDYYNSTPYYFDNRNYYTTPYNFNTSPYTPYNYNNQTNMPFRQDKLGTRWVGQEKQWKWTWVRRGNSNAFDATYTHPHDNPIYATVYITLNGNQVIAQRRHANEGGDCDYVGVIQGNTASGSYTCQQGTGTVWSATIEGQGDTTPGTEVSSKPFNINVPVFGELGFTLRGTILPGGQQLQLQAFVFGNEVANKTIPMPAGQLPPFEGEYIVPVMGIPTKVKWKLIIGSDLSRRELYYRFEARYLGETLYIPGPKHQQVTTIATW